MQASSSTKTSSVGEENSTKGEENSGEVENQSSSECVTVAAKEEISEVRQVKTVALPEEEASTMAFESHWERDRGW